MPNERWQADLTHWKLTDGTEVEILNVIDDHSRFLVLALRSYSRTETLTVAPTRVRWVGTIQPTQLSRCYTVEVLYSLGQFPEVRVIDPPPEPDEDGFLPHTFSNKTLCLHEDHEWRLDQLIPNTILPWAAEWLYFYEFWKVTGKWLGDGDERTAGQTVVAGPGSAPRNRAERRRATPVRRGSTRKEGLSSSGDGSRLCGAETCKRPQVAGELGRFRCWVEAGP